MQTFFHREPARRDRDMTLIFCGHVFFQAVVAAHRLGLYTALARQPGLSREALAAEIAVPVASVRALLMALQSLGLVQRTAEGGYKNAGWVTSAFASSDVVFPSLVEGFEQILYRPFSHLTEALRAGTNLGLEEFPGTGNTLYERLQVHPEQERVFHAWMSSLSSRGLPPRLVSVFSEARHALDVGGGDGTNAIILTRAHPELKVTILDLPSVCARAQERTKREQLDHRIDTMPCDIRDAELPSGRDAILFSRIFNIYSESQNAAFVARAARALEPGGKLVVYPSTVAEDDEGGPLSAAFLSLYFLCLATGDGRVYAPADYERWFRDAGFSSMTCTVDERDEAVIVGVR